MRHDQLYLADILQAADAIERFCGESPKKTSWWMNSDKALCSKN